MNDKISNRGNSKNTRARICLNKFLRKKISRLEGVTTILNAGCSQAQTDKDGTLYRDYFPSKQYYTLNNDPTIEDSSEYHFDMDLHDLLLLDRKFDLVLCNNVLEHVRNPFVVAQQLKSVTNKYLFINVPFMFPFHQKDGDVAIKDYWRFTDEGLRVLFGDLEEVWIEKLPSVITEIKDKKGYARWKRRFSAVGYAGLFKKE